jgi:hypothetical protein
VRCYVTRTWYSEGKLARAARKQKVSERRSSFPCKSKVRQSNTESLTSEQLRLVRMFRFHPTTQTSQRRARSNRSRE